MRLADCHVAARGRFVADGAREAPQLRRNSKSADWNRATTRDIRWRRCGESPTHCTPGFAWFSSGLSRLAQASESGVASRSNGANRQMPKTSSCSSDHKRPLAERASRSPIRKLSSGSAGVPEEQPAELIGRQSPVVLPLIAPSGLRLWLATSRGGARAAAPLSLCPGLTYLSPSGWCRSPFGFCVMATPRAIG